MNFNHMDAPMLQTQTQHQIRQISDLPAIHTYFDVIPESPDGQYVTFFAFDGKPLNHGTIMLARADGSDPIKVSECAGNAHGGANQGWLDNEHIFFCADGFIHIANTKGEVVEKIRGAVDTIHQGSHRALTHSANMRQRDLEPEKEQACYLVDLNSNTLTELLDRETAYKLLSQHMDMSQVPIELMGFKHTKWAPNGRDWFVVFDNMKHRKANPDLPRRKVIIAAKDDGSELRFIDEFGHHPNWMPDSSGIYAFDDKHTNKIFHWEKDSGQKSLLVQLDCEGHPCVHPNGQLISTDSYTYTEDGVMRVHLHDLRNGSTELIKEMPFPNVDWQLHHPPGHVCHAHPVWSADGKRLYYNAIVDEMPRLMVIDIDESLL